MSTATSTVTQATIFNKSTAYSPFSDTATTKLIGDDSMKNQLSSNPSTTTTITTICPHCGGASEDATAAQQRIQELEAQVRFLTARASETAEKVADYEDEIRNLREQAQTLNRTESHTRSATSVSSADPPPKTPEPNAQQQAQQQQQQGRFANFAAYFPSYRRSGSKDSTISNTPPRTSHSAHTNISNLSPPPSSHHPTGSYNTQLPDQQDPAAAAELQNALAREQNLRKAAESQLSQANSELEELTAQLFSQANEMVAQERKARAKLEERVALLEKRDGEKRKRLDRLEKAIERVERVRALVEQQ